MSAAAQVEVAAGVGQEVAAEVTLAPEERREGLAPTAKEAGAEAEVDPDLGLRGQEAGSLDQDLGQDPGRDHGQDHDLEAAARHAASQAVGAGVAAGSLGAGAGAGQEARADPDQAPGLRRDQDPNPGPCHLLGLIDKAVTSILYKKHDTKNINIPLIIINK